MTTPTIPGGHSVPLTIETLNLLAGRLRDHAENLAAELEFEPVVIDLQLAAHACDNFATLRFEVAEIAAVAASISLTTGSFNAVHHDLMTALDEAAKW
jgi:hypothetical protein